MSTSSQTRQVVIIEDNEADIETIRRALSTINLNINLKVFSNGDNVQQYLRKATSDSGFKRPDLIFLDLNLPDTDGRKLLKKFNHFDGFETVPIVVLTTSGNQKDIRQSYQTGANGFLTKPGPYEEYLETIQSACNFWLKL